MIAVKLSIIELGRHKYYKDFRLREIRAIENPHEKFSFEEITFCRGCNKYYFEEHLTITQETDNGEFFPACPTCLTDKYLRDIQYEHET